MTNGASKIEIRPAQLRDRDDLAQLCEKRYWHRQALGCGVTVPLEKSQAEIQSCVDNPAWLVLMAMCDGVPAGYATATVLRSGEYAGRGQLEDIFIAREHRRHGIGALLLQKMEDWLKSKHAEGFATLIAVCDLSALVFFVGKGYTWAKRFDGPVGAYQDAVEDSEMTTGEVSKYLRQIPADQLPEGFWMLKGGPKTAGLQRPFVRISLLEGEPSCEHNAGREWLAAKTTPAGMCAEAYHAIYPVISGLLNGAKYPGAAPDGGITLRCHCARATYKLKLER